jgi:hypothetical protein
MDIPVIQRLVKFMTIIEHGIEIGNSRYIPVIQRLIKHNTTGKHRRHIKRFFKFP